MQKAEKVVKTIEEDVKIIYNALLSPTKNLEHSHEVIDTLGKSLFLVEKQLKILK